MQDFTKLSNEELIQLTHTLASRVSFYNAAEGNWSKETADRLSTQAEFRAARDAMQERKLDFVNKGYLL